MKLAPLLVGTLRHGASDLHLQVGSAPMVRISGVPRRLEVEPLTKVDLEELAQELISRPAARSYPA